MKKFLTLVAAVVASVTIANAQIGIIGGVTSGTSTVNTEDIASNASSIGLYNMGLAYKIGLPLGFALQPELLYQIKGPNLGGIMNGETSEEEKFEFQNGFAELGLGIQWGLDLVAIRPYITARPFLGYQLTGNENAEAVIKQGTDNFANNFKNNLEYGLSVGVGLELIEHIQISFQFYKSFGNLFKDGSVDASAGQNLTNTTDLTNLENYNGYRVTLGLFF